MTLVRHRLLTPEGAPITGQKVTALLMIRDDLAQDSYALNAPEGSSFTGGVVRTRAVSTSSSSGWLEWDLTPNEYIAPAGTYYQLQGLSRARTILWVPDSSIPVDLSECLLGLVDFNDSNLVIVQGPRGRPGQEGATGNLSDTAVAGFVTTESSATRTAIHALVPDLAPELATKVSTETFNDGITQAKDRSNHTGLQSSASISDLTEAVQDIVGAFFGAGTGVSITYNDAQNSLTVSATGGTTDPEAVRDAIGAALIGVGVITVTVNDAGDTITLSTTATANATDAALRDRSTHTGLEPVAGVAAGTTLTVVKSGASWPARPTARADVVVAWKGADPSPAIVASGTGGMLDNVDYRLVTS